MVSGLLPHSMSLCSQPRVQVHRDLESLVRIQELSIPPFCRASHELLEIRHSFEVPQCLVGQCAFDHRFATDPYRQIQRVQGLFRSSGFRIDERSVVVKPFRFKGFALAQSLVVVFEGVFVIAHLHIRGTRVC